MSINRSTLLIALAVFVCSVSTKLVTLTNDNVVESFNSKSFVLVKFFAPWCGHCKSMAPAYESLAKDLANETNVLISEFDATQNDELVTQFGVTGYPTIILFAYGRVIRYEGERKHADMLEWMKRIVNAEIKSLSKHQLEKQKIGKEAFVLFSGELNQEESNIIKVLTQVSSVPVYHTAEWARSIDFYRIDKSKAKFTGAVSFDILDWSLRLSLPVVVRMDSQENIRVALKEAANRDLFLLMKKTDSKDFDAKYAEICEKKSEKIICVEVDSKMSIYSEVSDTFKAAEDLALFMTKKDEVEQAYRYTGALSELTEETLDQFVKDVNENKIESVIPKEQKDIYPDVDYEKVIDLNETSYDKLIKGDKAVLIEFYSKTCGYCKRLAPEYEKLATKLNVENSEFIIAAVHCEDPANIDFCQKLQIDGFPTVKLFVEGIQIPISEKRTAEAIEEYLLEVAGAELIIAGSANEVPNPAVIIRGASKYQQCRFLSLLFKKYPIYSIEDSAPFSVEVRVKDKVHKYTGEQNVKLIEEWIALTSEEVLVDILKGTDSPKLKKAADDKTPVVLVLDHGNVEQSVYDRLEKICAGKESEFICGHGKVGGPNFDDLVRWIGVSKDDKEGKIVYIDSTEFTKYLLPGNTPLTELTEEIIVDFVQKVKKGEIEAITSPAQEEEETPEQQEKKEGEQSPESQDL